MSFSDRDGVIWFDGQMVPWREAQVHVLTHTLHYGLGVFEGVRAYHTEQGPPFSALKTTHADSSAPLTFWVCRCRTTKKR